MLAVRGSNSAQPEARAEGPAQVCPSLVGVLQLLAVPVDLCNGADVFCLQ